VLRKLNEMPGIVKLDLDLGRGGEGAGRERLENAAAPRGNQAQQIIKLLMQGPKHLNEMVAAIGGKKSSFYTATSKLSKDGLVERGAEKGTWQLTAGAKTQLGGAVQGKPPPAVAALPAPKKAKKAPAGRAQPGTGNIVLRQLLDEGVKAPIELRQHMAEKGMSPKSISGVLDRARKGGLIKKNGAGYELTAAGRKIEIPMEAANG